MAKQLEAGNLYKLLHDGCEGNDVLALFSRRNNSEALVAGSRFFGSGDMLYQKDDIVTVFYTGTQEFDKSVLGNKRIFYQVLIDGEKFWLHQDSLKRLEKVVL